MASTTGNVAISFTIKPGVEKEIEKRVLAVQIRGAQHVVADAAKMSPKKTGTNARSIGWGVSEKGEASFGAISAESGQVSSSGINDNASNQTVIVATTSGYGGYLEVGTGRMGARPYIMPALEKNKGAMMSELEGIL